MIPELIRFSSFRHPFRVRSQQCSNPDCECTEVTFTLREVADSDDPVRHPLQFAISVDPETWQELKPTERPASMDEVVREFLRDYPTEERSAFREAGRQKLELRRRLREFRLDPQRVRDGCLVSFAEIACELGSIAFGGGSYGFLLEHAGTAYVVDDLYCPGPDCTCDEIRLCFFRCLPEAKPGGVVPAEQHFTATYSLAGRLQITECFNCTQQEAKAIASAWRNRDGKNVELLKWRYEKVKEIGRRSLSRQSAAGLSPNRLPDRPSRAMARAGRNDPCPCGSGKKYKKCCGQVTRGSL